MNKKVYYLIWEDDPQWWGALLAGEKSYANRDSQITFLEKTNINIPCQILGKFIYNLLQRDEMKVGNFINKSGDFGVSISEKEYYHIKEMIELYPITKKYEELLK